MKQFFSLVLMLTLLAGLAGCEVLGAAAETVAPSKTKAVYKPQNRVTLILVDDPANRLGNANLTDQIASVVEHELKQNEVITEFVPMRELHLLQQARGKAFDTMSLQDIGRALGAEQVLHVHIEQIDVDTGPGVVQPEAWVRLKFLDVATGRRLFPSDTHAAAGPSAGYELHSQMRQSIRPTESAGDRIVLFTRFANHIAGDVARVFYDHLPRQVGDLARELRDAR